MEVLDYGDRWRGAQRASLGYIELEYHCLSFVGLVRLLAVYISVS